MKIAIVSPYSWSVPGGVGNHVESLAERLRAVGHDVVVIAPADAAVPANVRSVGRSVGIPFNGSVARLAFGPRVALRVRAILRDERPDVVHVHEPFAPSVSMLAAIAAHPPVVATFHASMPRSALYAAASPVLRPLWRKIAAKIAVSDEAKRTVEARFGDGLSVIPNGVAIERFAAVPPRDPSSRSIVFVGRLEPRKGAAVLLRALPEVLEAVPDATLTIVGEGPQRASLMRAAESLPVSFAGRVDPAELHASLAGAAVVCTPSLGGESFGIVLLEAMAAGRPVVATAIPGYAAVAGDDAILVRPGDAADLARGLRSVLTDPDLSDRLATAGRLRAAGFSWDVVAGRIEAVYREVSGRR